MKLEVGKAYRTRDGRKAVITKRADSAAYPFGGEIYINSLSSYETWTAKGDVYDKSRVEHASDLISEWGEPAPSPRPWQQSISEIRQLSRESCAVACILAAVEGE